MSTVTPFAYLAVVSAVSGAITAWWRLRRDAPAQVVTPAAPPEPVDAEVTARLMADERADRLRGLGELAEEADADPELRQECVDELVAHLSHVWPEWAAWQAEVWDLLRPHLSPTSPRFWPGMDLHVEDFQLHRVDLRGLEVRDAVFHEVWFAGDARFDDLICTGLVSFAGARFTRHAFFRGARFETGADFEDVVFTATAAFDGVTAGGPMWFDGVRFSARTDFSSAEFADVSFVDVGFAGRTTFRGARFADAVFGEARFSGHADFTAAMAEGFDFTGARARTDVHVVRTWPPGWTLGPARPRKPGQWADLRSPRRS